MRASTVRLASSEACTHVQSKCDTTLVAFMSDAIAHACTPSNLLHDEKSNHHKYPQKPKRIDWVKQPHRVGQTPNGVCEALHADAVDGQFHDRANRCQELHPVENILEKTA